jgi:hypothetical protein
MRRHVIWQTFQKRPLYLHLRGISWLCMLFGLLFDPGDRDGTFPRNIGKHLADYMMSCSVSSYTSTSECYWFLMHCYEYTRFWCSETRHTRGNTPVPLTVTDGFPFPHLIKRQNITFIASDDWNHVPSGFAYRRFSEWSVNSQRSGHMCTQSAFCQAARAVGKV